METTLFVFAFLWGAVWGSFLNVVIWRLPRGENLAHPASACPQCGHAIRWYDNVPVLGWLWLRGKCRDCKSGISARYPFVELLVGLLSLALWWHVAQGRLNADTLPQVLAQFMLHFYFVATLVAITFIDLDLTIIPHKLSMPLIAWGFLSAILSPKSGVWVHYFPALDWVSSLIGFAMGFGLLFAVFYGYKLAKGIDGGGGGDLWLLGAIGANLGPYAIVFVLFMASMQGLIAALGASLIDRLRGRAAGAEGSLLLKGAHTEAYWDDHPVLGLEARRARGEEIPEDGTSARLADAASEDALEGTPEGGALGAQGAPDAASEEDEEGEDFMTMGVPFGPFLALAAIEYIFVGRAALRWVTSGYLP